LYIVVILNRYTDSFKALSHVLLLAPQNPFYVLQAAETAYTAGDIPLACKMYLLVVDMTAGEDGEVSAESVPTGITVRAWYGVKQVCDVLCLGITVLVFLTCSIDCWETSERVRAGFVFGIADAVTREFTVG
jgi:hypothetical protein